MMKGIYQGPVTEEETCLALLPSRRDLGCGMSQGYVYLSTWLAPKRRPTRRKLTYDKMVRLFRLRTFGKVHH